MKKHPNLTKDAPAPIQPEQTLVADITYVTSKQGTHYLSLVTDAYDCYQNALAERVNGILKNEFLLYDCSTMSERKQLIDGSVHIYNNVRPHLSLNMRTPADVHDSYLCLT
jgi:transposase InsO family protein